MVAGIFHAKWDTPLILNGIMTKIFVYLHISFTQCVHKVLSRNLGLLFQSSPGLWGHLLRVFQYKVVLVSFRMSFVKSLMESPHILHAQVGAVVSMLFSAMITRWLVRKTFCLVPVFGQTMNIYEEN